MAGSKTPQSQQAGALPSGNPVPQGGAVGGTKPPSPEQVGAFVNDTPPPLEQGGVFAGGKTSSLTQGEDLAGGKVTPEKREQIGLGIQEHEQFLSHRQSLFSAALALATVLYIAAIGIALVMLGLLASNEKLHWHASLLVAAFIIPPTVIVIGLMRGIFRSGNSDKDDTGIPFVDMTKDVYKEVMKRGFDSLNKPHP